MQHHVTGAVDRAHYDYRDDRIDSVLRVLEVHERAIGHVVRALELHGEALHRIERKLDQHFAQLEQHFAKESETPPAAGA